MNKPTLAFSLLISFFFPITHAATESSSDEQNSVLLKEVKVKGVAEDKKNEGKASSGYRYKKASVGPLGNIPLKETPYSVNVTSGEQIGNRSAHTASDALKTNPTVATLMEPNGYSSLSRVMIRGFTAADQSELRDGMVDRSFTFPPLENVDRIEVLNGVSGFLYGFSAMGGSVNYVSKQPTNERLTNLSTGTYGGGINYLHADAGGPMDDNGVIKYRTNIYRENGSTYIDGGNQQRTLLSGVITTNLNEKNKVTFDYWHQDYYVNSLQTYINVNPTKGIYVPDASKFKASRQYGQSWSYNQSTKDLVGIGFQSDISQHFALRTGYRYGDMWRQYNYVGATLTDNNGHYTETNTASPRQNEQTYSSYALVDSNFETGALVHQVTTGYTGTQYDYTRGVDVKTTLGSSNINNPTFYSDPDATLGGTTTIQGQTMTNFVLGDRIVLPHGFSTLLGITHAELEQYSRGVSTLSSTASTSYKQSKNTPSAALLYTPWDPVTTYVSYMEGLNAGGTAPSTASNANEMLAPSASKQYEVGAKSHLGAVDLNTALFRINKINEYTDPTDNIYKQDGRQQHQGLEITLTGKATDNLVLSGGTTWLDAKIVDAKNNTRIEGKRPVNVPEYQSRLFSEYTLPADRRFTLIGGMNYYGKRPVDDLNTDYIDSATTFDTGVRFSKKPFSVNFNVSNVFDKSYWSYYRSGDGLSLGAPRMFSLTGKIDF